MVFSCRKCPFVSDSEKGLKIHISKTHFDDASIKTGSDSGTSRGTPRPSSARGRGRGSSNGTPGNTPRLFSSTGSGRGSSNGTPGNTPRLFSSSGSGRGSCNGTPGNIPRPFSSTGSGRGRQGDQHKPIHTSRPSSSRGRGFESHREQTWNHADSQHQSFSRPNSSRGWGRGSSHRTESHTEEHHQGSDASRSTPDCRQRSDSRQNSKVPDILYDIRPSTSSKDSKSAVKDQCNEVKLDKKTVSEVSRKVNRFIEEFQEKLEELSGLKFERLNSGSYYDKTKNFEPDEFDFMFSPKSLSVKADYRGATDGYCKLEVMAAPRDINSSSVTGKYLDPSKFKVYIFDLFDSVFADGLFRKGRQVKKKDRSGDSPAYTILYTGFPGKVLDIDLVPAIEILGWPYKAKKVAPTWTSDTKLTAKCMERYHAVAKTCPDEVDGASLFWRISFSWAEKELIMHANVGDSKGCRKTVFRLLKGTLETTKNEHKDKIKKFCSYHLKMFMLGQFEDPKYQSDSENSESLFIFAMGQLLKALCDGDHMAKPKIRNYFIPTDNVIRNVPPNELNLVCTGLKKKLAQLGR